MLYQNKKLCYPVRRVFNTFMMHPKGVHPNTKIHISIQAAVAMWFSLSWCVLERSDSPHLFWLLKFVALFQSWRRCCLHPCLSAGQHSPLPTSLSIPRDPSGDGCVCVSKEGQASWGRINPWKRIDWILGKNPLWEICQSFTQASQGSGGITVAEEM